MTQQNLTAVVLWMIGALVSFSAAALAVRELSPVLNVFEMLAIRNASGLAVLVPLALARPALWPDVRPRHMTLHVFRNLVHYLATAAWAAALTLLPLATVFALEFTMPAIVALLAVVFLKERMTVTRAASIVLGFVGVLIILRPGIATIQLGALVALGAALGFAVTAIATKKLTGTQTTFAILFWMNLIQLPINWVSATVVNMAQRSLDFTSAAAAFATKLDAGYALPIVGLCAGGLLSHYCLTNAYRFGDASVVVPIDFVRVPLIAFIGWWLYGEALDPFVLIGSVVIIAGIVWNLRAEARRG